MCIHICIYTYTYIQRLYIYIYIYVYIIDICPRGSCSDREPARAPHAAPLRPSLSRPHIENTLGNVERVT